MASKLHAPLSPSTKAASSLATERVDAYSWVLLAFWVALLASTPWTLPDLQIARDFAAFWTAGRLALAGDPASAYGPAAPAALAALFGPATYPPFFYPPPALLLWLPFAAMPFKAAAALWVASTAALYLVVLRRLANTRTAAPVLAFPGLLVCALYGQNSLLSAALFGAAALTLQARPLLAGACIGALAFKPQLALLAPLAFALAGRWRAFAAAAVVATGLAALSFLLFGLDTWRAFLAVLPAARAWNESGAAGFEGYPSIFAGLRLLGATPGLAWVAQGAAAVAAIASLVVVVRRRPGAEAEMAVMVAATPFCMPFMGVYELAVAAIPAAWLIAEAGRTGWRPYEAWSLPVLYLAPAVIIVAGAHHLPLGPPALACLLALVAHRALAAPASAATAVMRTGAS